MSGVRIVVVLWGALFFVLGPLRSPGDGDLFWQRWLGDLVLRTHALPNALGAETFTSAGARWVPQEWLFSVAVAFAADHAAYALFEAVICLIPALVLVSIAARSRETNAPQAVAIVLLACGVAMVKSFGVRAQVAGWGALAAFLWSLDRRDRWYYASLPIVVLWANLHASVMLAPAIVLVRVASETWIGGWQALKASRDLRILPFVALATLCTPLGTHLPAYAFGLVASPIRHFVDEWQPSGFGDLSFTFGALPIALLAALDGFRALVRRPAAWVAAMLFVAMLGAVRNIPIFAIAAAPLAAGALARRMPALETIERKVAGLERFAFVSIAVAVAASAAVLLRMQHVGPPRLPQAAFAEVSKRGVERRVFCENFAWCSVALQYPSVRVFMDGRCDPYPVAVWQSYVATIELEPAWKRTLRRYGVDTVVAARFGLFAAALSNDPEWRREFEDAAFVVYARRA